MSRAAPEIYTINDVAERLHVSRRWFQDFLRGKPYGRMLGRKRVFTEADIAALIEELACPSGSSLPARAKVLTGTSAGPYMDDLSMRLQKRETRKVLKNLRNDLSS